MTVKLSGIHIYPVKGLGGITLEQSDCTTRGLRYDRRFMVVDRVDEFVSQREIPKMATIWTAIIGSKLEIAAAERESVSVDIEPRATPTHSVRVWSSHVSAQTVSAEADTWLSDYLGRDVRLVYMPNNAERFCNPEYAKNNEMVSFADGFPYLMTNEASHDNLNQKISRRGGAAIPMNRFRSNLVVSGATAWAEDDWKDIAIGSALFRVAKPCARCQVTTTDQATGAMRGPEPLMTLSTFRDTNKGILFGVNLVPVKLGTVRVGDQVEFN
jgi:uncharacterized protein YcbX